jgi:hypothetical protein
MLCVNRLAVQFRSGQFANANRAAAPCISGPEYDGAPGITSRVSERIEAGQYLLGIGAVGGNF